MKPLIFALLIVFASGDLSAQTPAWQPSPGHTQVPIWPGAAPDARPAAGPETTTTTGKESLVAGKPWVAVSNVSQSTMEACDWLTSEGITCVLLKYRVPAPRSSPNWGAFPQSPMALEDAQRTVGLVRFHAAEWHIDPHKIGVLGFSAGGHLVAAMSVHFQQRLYTAVDAADKESCRPDFAVALYPGHLSFGKNNLELNPDIRARISHETPPTFLLQDEDDHVDSVEDSLSYYVALKKAGVPVEMHLYAQGGHAFGLRRTKFPVTGWPKLVETWLGTIGMISE